MPDTAHVGNVINLDRTSQIVAVKRNEHEYCQTRCQNIWIDLHKRIVQCRECGKVIEPFDWIKDHGYQEACLIARLNALEVEAQGLRQTVEDLQAEKKRVQANISQAKRGLLKEMGI